MKLLNNSFKKLLLFPLLLFVLVGALSGCSDNDKDNNSTISAQLKTLQVNLTSLTKQKKEEYFNDINQLLEKEKEKIFQLKKATQQNIEKEYDRVYEQYQSMKQASEDKQQEMYDKTVAALERLNKKIEEATEEGQEEQSSQ